MLNKLSIVFHSALFLAIGAVLGSQYYLQVYDLKVGAVRTMMHFFYNLAG